MAPRAEVLSSASALLWSTDPDAAPFSRSIRLVGDVRASVVSEGSQLMGGQLWLSKESPEV